MKRRARPVAQVSFSFDLDAPLPDAAVAPPAPVTFTDLLGFGPPARSSPAPPVVPEDTCAACGCTDEHPCRDAAGKVACSWMRRGDPRCSRCIVAAEQAERDPWGLAPPGLDVDDLEGIVYPSVYDGGSAAPWEGM